jgi:predicted dehydrogenase
MKHKKIRAGIIGLGGHQQGYGGALEKHDNVEIVSIYAGTFLPEDETEKRLNAFLKYTKDNISIVYTLEELLAMELDLVSIAVDAKDNPEIVIKALKSGCNVICEKPVANSSKEVLTIKKAVKETGKVFSWNVPLPVFGRSFFSINELLKYKKINNPLYGFFSYIANGFFKNPSGNTSEIDNFGPYGFLAFRHAFKDELVSLFAKGGAFFYDSYKQKKKEDLAVINLEFTKGATGLITVGRSSCSSMPQDIHFELFSKDGAVDISSGLGEKIKLYSDIEKSKEIVTSNTAIDDYIEDVINAIKENRLPKININDALAVVKFCEMCRESLKTGQPISCK